MVPAGVLLLAAALAVGAALALPSADATGWQRWETTLARGAGWLLGGTLAGLAGVHLWRGPRRLVQPLSGQKIPRWSYAERVLHWCSAGLFGVLAVTGSIAWFAPVTLAPAFGSELSREATAFANTLHNLVGPLFMAGLLLMIAGWWRDNLPTAHAAPAAQASNGRAGGAKLSCGLKAWFWLLVTLGSLVCLSGLTIDFFAIDAAGNARRWLQLLHGSGAAVLIAAACGHIYFATIGLPGVLEGMRSGQVDRAWAEQYRPGWVTPPTHAPGATPERDTDRPDV